MKKNHKKLMYLSGALIGLGALKIYLNRVKRNEELKEQSDDSFDSEIMERKYNKIKEIPFEEKTKDVERKYTKIKEIPHK
mgnify:FL=1